MNPFLRWTKCYIKCAFFNGDFERLMNLCHHNHIEIWDMNYQDQTYYGTIYLNDFYKLKPLLKKTHVKIKILERHGYRFFLHFLSGRSFLWLGCVMCILGMLVLSTYIWKIEINGNSFYTDEQIIKYLKENENLGLGSKKSSINRESVEDNLMIQFEKISWTSSYINGTTLIIDVEEIEGVIEDEKNESKEYDICASMDGEITRIVLRSGTACVKQGDIVKQGDLLVHGIVDFMDDSLNIVERRWVGADADVLAKTIEHYNKVYKVAIKSQKFDKSIVGFTISIGGHSLNLQNKKQLNNLTSDYQHTSEFLRPFPGVWIQKDVYRTYEKVDAIEHIMDAKQQAENEMSDIYREFIEKGVQIIENNVRIVMYEDRVEVKGNLVLIRPIGEFAEYAHDPDETIENGETYEYNRNDN